MPTFGQMNPGMDPRDPRFNQKVPMENTRAMNDILAAKAVEDMRASAAQREAAKAPPAAPAAEGNRDFIDDILDGKSPPVAKAEFAPEAPAGNTDFIDSFLDGTKTDAPAAQEGPEYTTDKGRAAWGIIQNPEGNAESDMLIARAAYGDKADPEALWRGGWEQGGGDPSVQYQPGYLTNLTRALGKDSDKNQSAQGAFFHGARGVLDMAKGAASAVNPLDNIRRLGEATGLVEEKPIAAKDQFQKAWPSLMEIGSLSSQPERFGENGNFSRTTKESLAELGAPAIASVVGGLPAAGVKAEALASAYLGPKLAPWATAATEGFLGSVAGSRVKGVDEGQSQLAQDAEEGGVGAAFGAAGKALTDVAAGAGSWVLNLIGGKRVAKEGGEAINAGREKVDIDEQASRVKAAREARDALINSQKATSDPLVDAGVREGATPSQAISDLGAQNIAAQTAKKNALYGDFSKDAAKVDVGKQFRGDVRREMARVEQSIDRMPLGQNTARVQNDMDMLFQDLQNVKTAADAQMFRTGMRDTFNSLSKTEPRLATVLDVRAIDTVVTTALDKQLKNAGRSDLADQLKEADRVYREEFLPNVKRTKAGTPANQARVVGDFRHKTAEHEQVDTLWGMMTNSEQQRKTAMRILKETPGADRYLRDGVMERLATATNKGNPITDEEFLKGMKGLLDSSSEQGKGFMALMGDKGSKEFEGLRRAVEYADQFKPSPRVAAPPEGRDVGEIERFAAMTAGSSLVAAGANELLPQDKQLSTTAAAVAGAGVGMFGPRLRWAVQNRMLDRPELVEAITNMRGLNPQGKKYTQLLEQEMANFVQGVNKIMRPAATTAATTEEKEYRTQGGY